MYSFSSRFTGSDIDGESLAWATKNVGLNGDYSTYIRLLLTEDCSVFQRALLDHITCESSILEFKVGNRQILQNGDVINSADSELHDERDNDRDEGSEKLNEASKVPHDPRNQYPITRFLMSQYCSHMGIDMSISLSTPLPLPPPAAPAAVNSTPTQSLTFSPPFTGPVRSALMASGIRESEAVRRLERVFVCNNAHLHILRSSKSSDEECSVPNEIRFDAITQRESNNGTADDHHMETEKEKKKEKKKKKEKEKEKKESESAYRDQEIEEKLFYSACMTNPPFYDEVEKV